MLILCRACPDEVGVLAFARAPPGGLVGAVLVFAFLSLPPCLCLYHFIVFILILLTTRLFFLSTCCFAG